jgi:putative transposase
MSAAISPSTGRPCGVQRVCRIIPRSTFYRTSHPANAAPAKPRGPPVDDESLLAAIRADLAASPFSGEGHRKVWARLHYGLGLPVGRNRVLRLMRDNQPLSPFRRPPRPANDHDGTILTEAPDVMWGTDATLVQTAEEGRVWVFAAIDHFNSEVVGHHVSAPASRRSSRSARRSPPGSAGSRPIPPTACRCAWTTGRSTHPTTSLARSATGAWR